MRAGNECVSRFRSRISREASSKVTGEAVLAISRAISCFCRIVAYIAWHPMKAQSGGRSCPKESQQMRHARHTTYFAGATLGRSGTPKLGRRFGRDTRRAILWPLAKSRVLGALGRLAAGLLACPHRWQSNSGCNPVSYTNAVSAADLSFPLVSARNSLRPMCSVPLCATAKSACGAEASDTTGGRQLGAASLFLVYATAISCSSPLILRLSANISFRAADALPCHSATPALSVLISSL